MTNLLVILFFGFVTAYTGPAFDEFRAKRKAKKDRPLARVIYLPSAVCQAPGPLAGRCQAATCAICGK